MEADRPRVKSRALPKPHVGTADANTMRFAQFTNGCKIAGMPHPVSNVVGIDDAPFHRRQRGQVPIIGAVFARERLVGVLRGAARRDGANATHAIATMIQASRFREHVRGVLLQGIALAGFNVIDIHALHRTLQVPVMVIADHEPDLDAIHDALRARIPGGARKWRLIERAGPMEPVAGVWVQRAGLSYEHAEATVRLHARHATTPEPIRVAHLIAESHG